MELDWKLRTPAEETADALVEEFRRRLMSEAYRIAAKAKHDTIQPGDVDSAYVKVIADYFEDDDEYEYEDDWDDDDEWEYEDDDDYGDY